MTLLSVVTVVLDDRKGLEATAASLATQTWSDFEWIVKDGGSTDGTRDVLETIEPRPARIASGRDGGIYGAMNAALALCSGEWVLFLNAGDTLCSPQTLADIATWLTSTDRDWGFGAVRNIDASGNATGFQSASPFNISGLAIGQTTVPHQATFMRRDLLERLGGFATDFGTEADQELIYRAALQGLPFEMVWPIADFRVGGRGMHRPTGHFARAMRRARRAQHRPMFGSNVLDVLATGVMLAKEHAKGLELKVTDRLSR